jgi:hypothetical protein
MRPGLSAAAASLALVALTGGTATSHAMRAGATLTIAATPDPILAGEAVLVYGQLNVPAASGKEIVLRSRASSLVPSVVVQTTTTDSAGFYEFALATGTVTIDQRWYVTSPGGIHSRAVREHVASELTLAASSATGETNQPFTFSGTVDPAGPHVGEQVHLQKLIGDKGDTWKTIGHAAIDSSGGFTISRGFVVPGEFELRASLNGDASNEAATSDALSVTVQQAQNSSFTVNTSAPVIDFGQTATISGVLYESGSTGTPASGTSVTLWGKRSGAVYAPLTVTTTAADGGYSFIETPTQNETYQVRTTFGPGRRKSAGLFEGVRDVVTMSVTPASLNIGAAETFSGTVRPDKAGDSVYLERLGGDGAFNVVATAYVRNTSSFEFVHRIGSAGTKTFRVRIAGDTANVGGVSSPVTVTATAPPVSSLPPAS